MLVFELPCLGAELQRVWCVAVLTVTEYSSLMHAQACRSACDWRTAVSRKLVAFIAAVLQGRGTDGGRLQHAAAEPCMLQLLELELVQGLGWLCQHLQWQMP